jgi:hypothetical protein
MPPLDRGRRQASRHCGHRSVLRRTKPARPVHPSSSPDSSVSSDNGRTSPRLRSSKRPESTSTGLNSARGVTTRGGSFATRSPPRRQRPSILRRRRGLPVNQRCRDASAAPHTFRRHPHASTPRAEEAELAGYAHGFRSSDIESSGDGVSSWRDAPGVEILVEIHRDITMVDGMSGVVEYAIAATHSEERDCRVLERNSSVATRCRMAGAGGDQLSPQRRTAEGHASGVQHAPRSRCGAPWERGGAASVGESGAPPGLSVAVS